MPGGPLSDTYPPPTTVDMGNFHPNPTLSSDVAVGSGLGVCLWPTRGRVSLTPRDGDVVSKALLSPA